MQCCLFHGIYLCILGLYLYFIHFQKPREQMKNNKCFTGPAVPNIHDSLSHGQMSRSPEFSRLPAEKNMEKNGAKGVELTQAVKFTSWNSRDAWQKCMRTHTHTHLQAKCGLVVWRNITIGCRNPFATGNITTLKYDGLIWLRGCGQNANIA